MNKATVVCVLCNNAPTMACSGCQEMLYCSVACQADDAPIHKFICCLPASTTPPPSSDPPTEEDGKHVLGVLFPETSANPTLVWVRIGGFADEESGISFQEPEITPLFPGDNVTLESIHSERNRTRNRDTKSMLEVWHANKSASASASQGGENLCISALAAAGTTKQPQDSGPFYEWKGPVLVLFMTRSTGFMVDPGSYQDCQVHDFRDAVDFVLDYGNDAHHAKKIREALDTLGSRSRVITDVEAPRVGKGQDAAVSGGEADDDAIGSPKKSNVIEMDG